MTAAPDDADDMTASKTRTRVLRGERFQLVPLKVSDIDEDYLGWLDDPEVTRFLEVRHQPQTLISVTKFVRSFYGSVEKYIWKIVPNDAQTHIGTCTLYNINRHHDTAEIGLMIGDRRYWGSGASADAISILSDFAFADLGLRRLTGGSYSKNRGMNFTYRRLGFTLEGKMRMAVRVTGDEFSDVYRWGLLAHERRGST